jgi:hypothetical protein
MMANFLNIFKHLLPRARAWQITIDKQLRQFFTGLTEPLGDDSKEYVDDVYEDLDPQKTRELATWESQFGLSAGGLTEQERRDRLEATWAATGGQSPKYLQDTIQAAGFTNVYIHEWFDPVGLPAPDVKLCVTPRDPNSLVGLKLMANRQIIVKPNWLTGAGEALMEAGESIALAGNYNDLVFEEVEYGIPTDPDMWAYILYFGGQTYGTQANIAAARQVEFETLIMKLKPAQQWAGLLINYV